MDPVRGTFVGFGFSPILLSDSSGQSVLVQFSQYVRDFLFPHAGFSVFSFHMPILSLSVKPSRFLVLFMQSQRMNFLYLHAAIPVGFFKILVIISCCIFMSDLLFGLYFLFCFKQIPQVFVLNKCVL